MKLVLFCGGNQYRLNQYTTRQLGDIVQGIGYQNQANRIHDLLKNNNLYPVKSNRGNPNTTVGVTYVNRQLVIVIANVPSEYQTERGAIIELMQRNFRGTRVIFTENRYQVNHAKPIMCNNFSQHPLPDIQNYTKEDLRVMGISNRSGVCEGCMNWMNEENTNFIVTFTLHSGNFNFYHNQEYINYARRLTQD